MCLETTSIATLPPAAKLLARPGGWCQGSLDDSKGAYCIIGAIKEVYGPNLPDVFDAVHKLHIQLDGQGAVSWNDAPGRTQAEAVALLVKAGV